MNLWNLLNKELDDIGQPYHDPDKLPPKILEFNRSSANSRRSYMTQRSAKNKNNALKFLSKLQNINQNNKKEGLYKADKDSMTNEGIYINYKHKFRPNSNAITSTKNTSSQAFRSKVVSSICKARNSMQALSRPDSQSYLIKKRTFASRLT